MTMDYNSPWSEREIWPFLKVAVSPKLEKSYPPKSVHMHVTSIPTCMNFLSQFQSIKFFDDHGQSMIGKGNLAIFESSNIFETEEVTPTKIGVYAFDINPYMHRFLGPILID